MITTAHAARPARTARMAAALGAPRSMPAAAAAQPLSATPSLRRIAAPHRAWCERLAAPVLVTLGRDTGGDTAQAARVGHAELSRIDAARWSDADSWPLIRVSIAGVLAPMRLAPHRQWSELADVTWLRLDRELRIAIAAHLTTELRQALGIALHAAGLAETPSAPAVEEQPDGDARDAGGPAADDAAGPAIVLSIRMQLAGATDDADSEPASAGLPCIAWIRLPATLASLPPAPPSSASRAFDPPVQLRALVAGARVPWRALARLAPGSVVLLDPFGSDAGVLHAWLIVGRQRIARLFVADWPMAPSAGRASPAAPRPAVVTFARWAVAHERATDEAGADFHTLRRSTNAMDFPDLSRPSDKAQAASRTPDALAEVTVDVQAVIDLAPARISELQQWSPGMVLGASAPVDGTQVALRVAGHVVGRGRLVAVDSLLGLELLELYD